MMRVHHGNVYRGGGKRYTPEQREAAFWAKVAKGAPDACWPWQGAVTTHGYGCFSKGHGKSVIGAHKAAYQYAKGEVPAGMEIMHACDKPLCCNPAHLSLGTRQDNIADRVAKGRSYRIGNAVVPQVPALIGQAILEAEQITCVPA